MRKYISGIVVFVLLTVILAPSALARTSNIAAMDSPILRLRAEQSKRTLGQAPDLALNDQTKIPVQHDEVVAGISQMVGSNCPESGCAISVCIGSVCVMSMCDLSLCIASIGCGSTWCAVSCDDVSGCDSYCEPTTTCEFSSHCFGSNCSSSGCVNSTYCSDSICVGGDYCKVAPAGVVRFR
jgi:hypothetical protein